METSHTDTALKAPLLEEAIRLYGLNEAQPYAAEFLLDDGRFIGGKQGAKGHVYILGCPTLAAYMDKNNIDGMSAKDTFCDITGAVAMAVHSYKQGISVYLKAPMNSAQTQALSAFAQKHHLTIELFNTAYEAPVNYLTTSDCTYAGIVKAQNEIGMPPKN